ncbi:polysaccharide deacetylase family protein [Arthrobacter sp. PAMC 25486]|uniref:polysaccharide deacetylase family protein n=1 Tax=Arthrobacter sp. PAMC 25486 TaxID=1494608 RepID=UPI00138E2CC9|nr:polysaccharide deacetylase family protein [Arthrobacter sp. PAMC 25486]
MLSVNACSISPAPVMPSPTPAPPPESVAGQALPSLDPSTVPGALPMTIHVDGVDSVRAKWVYLNGGAAYNSQLDAQLLGILDQHAGGRFNPAVAAPEKPGMANGLKLAQDIILAGGNTLGTRFTRSEAVAGTMTLLSETTSYTDLATGDVQGGPALLAPESVETVRALLSGAIVADGESTPATHQEAATPAASDASAASATSSATATGTEPGEGSNGTAAAKTPAAVPPAADALLGGAAFSRSGELVVPVQADPVTGIALPESVNVHITAEAASPLLSDLGRQLRQLAEATTAFTAPPPAASGQEHINCDLVPCAALTYDDGPNDQTTRLLKILADRSVYATFFEQGSYAASYPEIAAATAAAGHVIANHTVNHPYLSKLSLNAALGEVQGATDMIAGASGATPRYLRPPYGDMTARIAGSIGMPVVNWSVDSQDWLSRNKEIFIPKVMELIHPGSIILQHDIHRTTVDGQAQLIDDLHAAGYQLVTVPQLFQGIEMHNGQSYFCRGDAYPCTPGR